MHAEDAPAQPHELELETPNRGLRIHATNRIVMRDHNDDPKYLVVVIEDIPIERSPNSKLPLWRITTR